MMDKYGWGIPTFRDKILSIFNNLIGIRTMYEYHMATNSNDQVRGWRQLGGSQRTFDRTYGLYFWDTKGKWLGPWEGILPPEIKTTK